MWFKFFLAGITETAKNSIATFDNILKPQRHVDGQIRTLGSRTAKAQKIRAALVSTSNCRRIRCSGYGRHIFRVSV